MKIVVNVNVVDDDLSLLDTLYIDDIERFNFDKPVAFGAVSSEIIEFIVKVLKTQALIVARRKKNA